MSNGLILAKDINKEEFDMLKLEMENVSQYLAYYALLLSTAWQYGLISQIEAEEISKTILGAFDKKFENDSIVMANNMYVLTSYLMTMKNSKQIEILSNISNNSIDDLFDEANVWFSKEIRRIECQIMQIKSKVYSLKDDNIIISFKELESIINECKEYSKIGTTCDFKKRHKRSIALIYLFALNEDFKDCENFLQTLENVVETFKTEISILSKLDLVELMKNLKISNKREIKKINIKNEIERKKLEMEMNSAKDFMEQEIERAKKISENLNVKLNELEEKDRLYFKKENPDLVGQEFEDAFEEWQLSLPDEHFDIYEDNYEDDLEVIEKAQQRYRKIREKILEKLKTLDKMSDEDIFELESRQISYVSIESVFKMLAIIEIQKVNPEMIIPLNSKELAKTLENFELSQAVQIVLSTIKPDFSETELSYLKSL